MRTVRIYENSDRQVACLPAEMAYEGVTELEILRNGDMLTLRPSRTSWASFLKLPKANTDHLQKRPNTVSGDVLESCKKQRLGFLSGQNKVLDDFDRIAVEDHQLDQIVRVSSISLLAAEVLENKESAVAWLSRPNEALGGQVPMDPRPTSSAMR